MVDDDYNVNTVLNMIYQIRYAGPASTAAQQLGSRTAYGYVATILVSTKMAND